MKNLPIGPQDKYVSLNAVFEGDNLVEIRFEKNFDIPQRILKVVGLVLRFHPHLKTLTFKSGIDCRVVYEVGRFLPYSHLTDICFDGCSFPESNYHILLDQHSHLSHLSLSRCNIDDKVVELLAERLHYPKPASMTLSLLNLSSNQITDASMIYFAEALRSNRQLHYLNLSSNQLTDQGIMYMLNIFMQFPLTYDEIVDKRARHHRYLKEKNELLETILRGMKADDSDKKSAKRKTTTPKTGASSQRDKKTKTAEDLTSKSTILTPKVRNSFDVETYENAKIMSHNILGVFDDPYSYENTTARDGYVYCFGNNSLCYLNIAYNNLTYCVLPKLLRVLEYQKLKNRRPKGLLNIIIEGNNLPNYCREMSKIDYILETGIIAGHRQSMAARRKINTKGQK